MSRTVNVGIIGCGGIANSKHMSALKDIKEVEMVAFCDIILEKAEKAVKEFQKTTMGIIPTGIINSNAWKFLIGGK